jgi:hypothetical protein
MLMVNGRHVYICVIDNDLTFFIHGRQPHAFYFLKMGYLTPALTRLAI